MNLAFDTHIFILICCLLQGLAGLKLIKVSIPAYKLRGESTFLECQYELNKSKGLYGGLHRSRSHHSYGHQHHQHHQHRQHGGNGNYDDPEVTYDSYRRMRARLQPPPQQQQQYQQQYQHQQQSHRQPYFQPLVQSYQSSGGSSGSAYYQQQPYNPEYPTLPPSPYGHSVYRGRSQIPVSHSSATSSSSSSSSSYSSASSSSSSSNSMNSNYQSSSYAGRVGASTYTGKTYGGTGGFATTYGHHHSDHDDSLDHDGEESREDHEENEGRDGDEDNGGGNDDANADDEEEGEDLYAIKWYKDNEEFYRFVPKANPPKTSYRVDGVRVIEEHSDSSRVLLRGLTINSTGLYRCEISAEAPNFSSVQGEGQMDIVYLPRDGPHIKGQQFQYQIGETLNLNCTSGKSHPASHLQWFINDQAIVDGQYLVRYNDTVHRHGLITSTLGLEMTVDGRHFHNGAMRVKCLASISPVLWKGGKESVLQRRPGIIDNREAMLLVRSSSSSIHVSGGSGSGVVHWLLRHWRQRHQRWDGGHKTLTALRVLTTTAILMKLCQLLLLRRDFI